MELSSGESALRTLKHRSKVPQAAVELSASIAALLFDKQLSLSEPIHDNAHDAATDDDSDAATALTPEQRRELLEQQLTTLFLYGKERWEPLAVACVVVRDVLAAHLHVSDAAEAHIEKVFVGTLAPTAAVSDTFAPFTDDFLTHVVATSCHSGIEHYEPRVRLAVAKLLGVLAKWNLAYVYRTFVPQLMEAIVCSMHRSPDFDDSGFDDVDDNISVNGMETPPQSPQSTPRTPSTPYRLDDVSGWKALESSLCALKFIVKGSGAAFLDASPLSVATGEAEATTFVYLTPELCDLVTTKSCFHINRHVRVVGLDTITELCVAIAAIAANNKNNNLLATNCELAATFCKCITRGLMDNWSQVRYAASIAARAFMVALDDDSRSLYLPTLVPRLCLNRYYVAERVSKHSQETWRLLFGTHGRDVVAQYMDQVVTYYVDMTTHSVREAACQCIGELGSKVDADAVRPFVATLMRALLVALYDSSWQVRDAACLAAAQLVLGFPTECIAFRDELFHLWGDHLGDEIWSVREDAAIALGNAVRAYGDDVLDRVVAFATDNLARAKLQPAMTQHELDARLQTAKKQHSSKAVDCCAFDFKTNERHVHRASEPWEAADGAVYLVRELCSVAPLAATQLLARVADVAILRHFPQTGVLQETIWKQLPHMCIALGKREFKRHVELFFDPLVFTLAGAHRLARFAAKDCVASLSAQIGPSIFLGRLQANPTWYDVLAPFVPSPPVV